MYSFQTSPCSTCAVSPPSTSSILHSCINIYRMKAMAPAPTAIKLAPTCMAPPVEVALTAGAELVAEPETAAALAVAEPETEAAAEPEAEEPVAARRVPQRDLAKFWMFWRSSAEQSEFWRRQVVPAARKALEPVVQRQMGSVASQPEEATAD